jgi:pyruvate dehydrogenase E1 component alpha subunit
MNDSLAIREGMNEALNSVELGHLFDLLYVREVELFVARNYSRQLFRCPVHLSIGQEAVAVGVCSQLEVRDHVVSTHRCHAHYLARGGSLLAFFGELLGKPIGCCGGRGGSMHLFDREVNFDASIPIVGSSLSVAVGIGYALSRESGGIVVSFQGDASYESGQFFEAINFAATHSMPVLVVIENNGFSTYSPQNERQPHDFSLEYVAKAYGIGYQALPGDDVDLVASASGLAVDEVRSGRPVILELSTFRRYEHCGPNLDDSLGYRSPSDIESYVNRDPVVIASKKCLESGTSEKQLESLREHICGYIGTVFDRALVANDEGGSGVEAFVD